MRKYREAELRVSGDFALFTRPDTPSMPTSYPVPTPAAAEGIIKAAYWHFGVIYEIDEIHILKPIQFISMSTNYRRSVIGKAGAVGQRGVNVPVTRHMLKDVDYLIRFRVGFDKSKIPNIREDIAKMDDHQLLVRTMDILSKNIRRGSMHGGMYLGTRECMGRIRPITNDLRPIDMTCHFGPMVNNPFLIRDGAMPFLECVVENGIFRVDPAIYDLGVKSYA